MVAEDPIDSGSLAAILAADYPLIDPPLILAILSDYPPELLSSSLPDIKDQLGILEATLVPDPDIPDIPSEPAESWTESTSLSGIDDISNKLDNLTTGTGTSGTWTSSSKGSKGSRSGSNEGKSEEGNDNDEFVDETELLKSLFPAISENDLTSVLNLYPTLQDAIDHLLSLELIRNVEEEGHWPEEDHYDVKVLSEPEPEGWAQSKKSKAKSKSKSKSKPASTTSSKPPSVESSPIINTLPNFEHINFPSSAHSRSSTAESSTSVSTAASTSGVGKKKKKDKIVIPLVDTLQRKPSPAPSRSRPISKPNTAPSSRSASPARNAITNSKSGPSNNAWHTVTSLSSYLSDLIPTQQPNYFLTYLHSPEYHSAYSAILASLAKLPSTTTRKNKKDNSSRKILEDIYGISLLDNGHGQIGKGQKDLERDLEICVHAAGEDIATVMDLMELLNEISEWPNDDDYGLFESRTQPDYTINHNPPSTTIIRPEPISLNLPPAQAVDMARSTSAGSTISNKSFDDHVPSKLSKSTLPGKMTRPEKKAKPIVVKEEHLSGGAIREAKIREVPGSKLSSTSLSHPLALDSFGTTSPIPSSPKLGSKNNKQVHIQNWRTVSHVRPPEVKSKDNGIGAREKRLTIEECIQNANLERARRETAIRAAGRSFKTNVNGIAGGGRAVKGVVAGHYALQAREAGARAKEWDMKAANLVVRSQISSTNQLQPSRTPNTNGNANGSTSGGGGMGGGSKTIDLHHLTINEGTTLVNELINEWWKFEKEIRLEGWKKQDFGKFIIITGVGRHSVNNKGVLGPAIASFLEKDGWKVDRGDSERGYLVVRGK